MYFHMPFIEEFAKLRICLFRCVLLDSSKTCYFRTVFLSFPQKRNGIVFSSGVNYLHSGDNIQSELSS